MQLKQKKLTLIIKNKNSKRFNTKRILIKFKKYNNNLKKKKRYP